MPIRGKIRPSVREVIRRLTECGHEAYIVGGAVRDLLLGLEPKDYDLATCASPEEIRSAFGRKRSRIIGRRFRLVHVYADDDVYEVSTFRREPTAEERRERVDDDGVMIWRDNQFGTIEQDAKRRDFTVNALYYDVHGDRGIIDFVGGVDDLNARVVRALGEPDVRIDEDPVRILRALKLVGQFGFSLEPQLAATVREKGPQIQLASANRLFEEVLKIVACPQGLPILTAFHESGFLAHFWPVLAACWDDSIGSDVRSLMAERARRLMAGACSTAKALGLATICLPFLVRELGGGQSVGDLWEYEGGLESRCRDAIQAFFEPFPVSRFFTARIRDIVLLLPRFRDSIRPTRLQRHPEYRYGRELYSLLVTCCGWEPELLSSWPVPQTESGALSRRHGGDRNRGRRRGRRGGRARQRRRKS